MHILENEALSLAIADKGAELGKYRLHGREYEMKTQHGFARDLDFVCTEESADSLCQVLRSTSETKARYPFDFRLQVRHRLDAENPRLLHIAWDVTNTGGETMYYAIGGHPGFLPPEGTKKEDCLLGFPGKAELHYISASPAGFALPDTIHTLRLSDSRAPYGATLPETWIFEEHQLDALHCEAFPILAVWAKAEGPFVCLEPWCGRTDDEGFTGEIAEKICEEALAPGETKQIRYRIEFHR